MWFPKRICCITFENEAQWLLVKDDCELAGRSRPPIIKEKFFAPLTIPCRVPPITHPPIPVEELCFPKGLHWYKEQQENSTLPIPDTVPTNMKTYLDRAADIFQSFTIYDNDAERQDKGAGANKPWITKEEFEGRLMLTLQFCHNYISIFCDKYDNLTTALVGCKKFFLITLMIPT